MKLKLPVILSADDYHEFVAIQETLEKVADCSEYGVPTKKLPAVDYVEIGCPDGSYIGLFYSPLILGKTLDQLKDNQEIVAMTTRVFIQDYIDDTKNVKVEKLRKFIHEKIEQFFEDEDHKELVDIVIDAWLVKQDLLKSSEPVTRAKPKAMKP